MMRVVFMAAAVVLLGYCGAYAFPAKDVYQNTSGAVVLIASGNGGSSTTIGAGSVVASLGIVVTNAHVVIDKDSASPYGNIAVYLKPDRVTGNLRDDLHRRFAARVLAYDIDLDLAVLRAEGLPSDIVNIRLADPGDVGVGEEVVAIGHPEQGGLWTLTAGMISGVVKDQGGVAGKDVYQTDTSVNRGNSGGPLLNGRGQLVGINTNIARVGAGNIAITGVNFALQSEVVKRWLGDEGMELAYGSAEGEISEPSQAQVAQPGGDSATPAINDDMDPSAEPSGKTGEAARSEGGRPVMEGAAETAGAPVAAQGATKTAPGDRILTPKRPYKYEDLLLEVERDMQDLKSRMQEMLRRSR